jgi:hypothetical protein
MVSRLVEHTQKVEQVSYERAFEELKAQQRQAAEMGDAAKVAEITEQLVKIKASENKPQPQHVDPQAELTAARDAFLARNPWYDSSRPENFEMIKYANEVDRNLFAANRGIDPHRYFENLERQVKAKFPQKFGINVNQVVEGHSEVNLSQRSKADQVRVSDLPSHHQYMIKGLQAKLGNKFNVKNYIQQLIDIGDIK